MNKTKILIVEDENLIALDLKEKVAQLNYHDIDVASTGEDALDKVLRNNPDIILMDINLGKGLDGIETAVKIQEYMDIPIIYVTANADMSTVERARNTGPYGYINKPVNLRDLYTTLDSALNSHSMKIKLHESEHKFRHIFDNATDGICIGEVDTRKIYLANSMFSLMTGYSNEELLNMTIGDLHPVESLTSVFARIDEVVNSNIKVANHIPMKRKDGSFFYTDITASTISLGNNSYVMGIFRDITENMVYEEALKKSEGRFRNIVQSSPMGIHMYEMDKTGNLIFTGANRTADTILGVDNSIFIGKSIEEAFPPLAETEVPGKYKLVASGGESWETEQIIYDDKKISGAFEVYAFQTEPGKMAAMFLDVTEKRKTEEEIKNKNRELAELNTDLKIAIEEHEAANEELINAQEELLKREEFLDSIFRVVPAGIGTTKNGVIGWINKMLQEMTGYDENELVEENIRKLYPGDSMYEKTENNLRKQILETGRGSVETEWVTKDGRVLYVLLAATTVSDNRQGDEITFTALDITERKHSQDMLIQSEKMMSVGGLAAGMAHEINNPLGIIMQGVQLIQNHLDFENSYNIKAAEELGTDIIKINEYLNRRKVLEYVYNIQDAGIRASNIVANMLQFSRKSDSKRSRADLNVLIDNSIEIASKDYDLTKKYDFRNISIIRNYHMDIIKIPCIETEIEQVIFNILKNSAQSISMEGDIINPEIKIITRMEDGYGIIEIIDNGPGMSREILNRIFEPFYTTKQAGSGTGLGLSVSYFIITNNHSGEISAESEPGGGTRFTIKLPVKVYQA